MARRRDISLATALGISMALHAAVLSTGWYGYVRYGYVQVPRSEVARPQDDLIVPIPPSFGDSSGAGESLNALEGQLPIRARQAPQDQAFLRRQEGAAFLEEVAPDSQESRRVRGPQSAPAARLPQPPDLSELATSEPARFGLASAVPAPRLPQSIQPPRPVSPARATPPSSHTRSGGGPLSASESDPFRAENPEIRFERGQIDVRFGRQVRTTRPRLSLAGYEDLRRLRYPTIVMRVETDARGNVISADIHRSSGSGEVDLACRIAMLDWWIEPPTDATNQPIPDVMYWRLSWR